MQKLFASRERERERERARRKKREREREGRRERVSDHPKMSNDARGRFKSSKAVAAQTDTVSLLQLNQFKIHDVLRGNFV
jgi:hypothetical protein